MARVRRHGGLRFGKVQAPSVDCARRRARLGLVEIQAPGADSAGAAEFVVKVEAPPGWRSCPRGAA